MRIELLESDEAIVTKMNLALIKKFKRYQPIFRRELRKDIVKALKTLIEGSPAWISLKSGVLAADLGLPKQDKESRLNKILGVWLESINVAPANIDIRGLVFSIQIEITGIKADYADVKALAAAVIKYVKHRKSGDSNEEIPWLTWLLEFGDDIIIKNFKVNYGSGGRSGKGYMVVSPGDSWGISMESGTADNNFLTRIIDNELIGSGLLEYMIYNEIKLAFRYY